MTRLTSSLHIKWKCWTLVPSYTQEIITFTTVAYTWVVECLWAFLKVCPLCRVMRLVTSTKGRMLTNGTNYKRGKLCHSPWHGDIFTPNQLNNWVIAAAQLVGKIVEKANRWSSLSHHQLPVSIWLDISKLCNFARDAGSTWVCLWDGKFSTTIVMHMKISL